MIIDHVTIFVVLIAIVSGIATGLLPGLPAWLAPFLITPFVSHMNIEHVLVFWLVTVIGSQFFGSIASIMFGIPGENSSLVYIERVRNFSTADKINLIRYTANGSCIATLVALGIVFLSQDFLLWMLPILGTTVATFFIVWAISLSIALGTNKNKLIGIGLFIVGVVLAPKSNIALPEIFIHFNQYTYDLSVMMLVASLMLLPELFYEQSAVPNRQSSNPLTSTVNQTKSTFIGTCVGIVCGFLPGPTATISSSIAFQHTPGSLTDKIVSAESADNSVVIIGGFLLLYLQIPLGMDSITAYNVITQQGWNMYDDFISKGLLTSFITVLAVSTVILWLLARNSNFVYALICQKTNTKWFVLLISLMLLATDVLTSYGSYNAVYYTLWFLALLVFGIVLKKHRINILPVLFGFIFGDQLIWNSYQVLSRW